MKIHSCIHLEFFHSDLIGSIVDVALEKALTFLSSLETECSE